jgi:type IV fimbrial biogenesis protein FimT
MPSRVFSASGFTLVELLVTLAVVSVLLVVGVPSMTQFLADRAAQANAEEFVQALRFARSEAMKRGRPVTVCASQNPEADAPTCSGSNTWVSGWLIVFADSNRVLRVQNALRSMRAETPIEADDDTIKFASTGIAFEGSGDYRFFPVGDDTDDGYDQRVRSVNLNTQGRIEVTLGSGS